MTNKVIEWPDWLPGILKVPDDQYLAGKLPLLATPPEGVVIHSGDTAPNVAEYITTHKHSYHFAHHDRLSQIVQTVPANVRAQHAGSLGNHWLAIALSGPDEQNPRSEWEKVEFQRVVAILVGSMPCVRFWCRHSDIDPKRRRDPGPGFLPEWIEPWLKWSLP